MELFSIDVMREMYRRGGELAHMFIDLVRGSNDAGALGFLSDARRLNVLITRQTVGLWIIFDERCVLTLGQQAERENPIEIQVEGKKAGKPEKKSREDQKHKTAFAMFAWMREDGRVVNAAKESLTGKCVEFPKPGEKNEEPLGWPAPAPDAKEDAVAASDVEKQDEVSTSDAKKQDAVAASNAEKQDAVATFDAEKQDVAAASDANKEEVDWNATVDESLWKGGQEEDGEDWANWGYS